MKTARSILSALLLGCTAVYGQNLPGAPGAAAAAISPQAPALGDALVATDALGRALPGYDEAGPRRPGRYVGLFYWLWHGPLRNGTGEFDISKVLEKEPERRQWPFLAYYWGEPEMGYYRSDDEYAMRRHLNLFCLLGIDFLYLDFTNLVIDKPELRLLLRLTRELREAGCSPPRLVPFFNTNPVPKIEEFYREFYLDTTYRDEWFVLDGKPLVLSPARHPTDTALNASFTWRRMWAGRDADGFWHYFDDYPQTPARRADGRPEQIAVAPGKGAPLWDYPVYGSKSSTTSSTPVYDRYWMSDRTGEGLFFEEQWKGAYEQQPMIVCVTGWNEWKAEAWPATPELEAARIMFQGRQLRQGESYFVDEFNGEFNRDLEPEAGERSDNYFYQLAAHVRRYKGMDAPPESSPKRTVRIDGRFGEWAGVRPVFTDFAGDAAVRDAAGAPPGIRYANATGRNDIVESRVAWDSRYIYFYVRTAAPLSPRSDPGWMLLFLDTDRDKRTGWEGYDFMLNGEMPSAEKTVLKKRDGNGWKPVAECDYRANGCEMEIAVPRRSLGLAGGKPDFGFHWMDNMQRPDDIREFFVNGDSAPERRYDYHYRAR